MVSSIASLRRCECILKASAATSSSFPSVELNDVSGDDDLLGRSL